MKLKLNLTDVSCGGGAVEVRGLVLVGAESWIFPSAALIQIPPSSVASF